MDFRHPVYLSLINLQDSKFNWAGPLAFGHEILPTDDYAVKKAKAEKQAARLTPHYWWHDNESLEVHQHIPGKCQILVVRIYYNTRAGIRRNPVNGKPLWFNTITARYGLSKERGASEPPHIGTDGMTYLLPTYRDGSEIPKPYLERLQAKCTRVGLTMVR